MEQLNIEQLQKDLPQLIVALDSLNDDANYIHIADAKDNVVYYCPCCKGIIKPRAYKSDIEYQVQPHFYHENGGCNEESFVHYICKTWLFEKGSQFKIGNVMYTVDNIETEKSLDTEFGFYRPDIIVYTDENKTFFFEIKYSNKKTEHYIPKWDELGNDVVEVDARYFINQKFVNDIPEFKLIYSDGECYIKSYTKSDYDDIIAKRKLEWKRQDKLNYKIMWERLDWFWIELQNYKNGNIKSEDFLNAFKSLDFYDIEDCWSIVSKMSCLRDVKDDIRNIANTITIKYFEILLLSLMKENNIIEHLFNYKIKKNFTIEWKMVDLYNVDRVYKYQFSEPYKKLSISQNFVFLFIEKLREKIKESCSNVKTLSIKNNVYCIIEKSRKVNQEKISKRNSYKNKIDIQSENKKNVMLCKIISKFVHKRINIKFDVFVLKNEIYFKSDFIKINFGSLLNQELTPKFIKYKCNEIIYSMKYINCSKITYREIDFYDYKSLTSTIQNIESINESTVEVNKILIANDVLDIDKNSFTEDYIWLTKNNLCTVFDGYYKYHYTSLRWNGIGSIWLEQNWCYFVEYYNRLQILYKEITNYFNSYTNKDYPTFKIINDSYRDVYILRLGTIKNHDYQNIVYINKDDFSFCIGKDYKDNLINFSYEKSEESLMKFLNWYMYGGDRMDIRFFKESEVNTND